MSKFKNFFPKKLDPQKRDLYFEFPNLIKTYKIYAYILYIFCLFRNFPRTRSKYSKVFNLFAFEICYISYRAYRIEISIVIRNCGIVIITSNSSHMEVKFRILPAGMNLFFFFFFLISHIS